MKKSSEAWPASSDRDLRGVTHCFTKIRSAHTQPRKKTETSVMSVVVFIINILDIDKTATALIILMIYIIY